MFSPIQAAKMGMKECVNHNLLLQYPVLYEKSNDHIAHVKFTILLQSGGTTKITGLPVPEGYAVSYMSIVCGCLCVFVYMSIT